MQLNDTQKRTVAGWIAAGAKLSEIQNKLRDEFDLRLTYMEVRLLVDDLKLMPKDAERPKPVLPPAPAPPLASTPAADLADEDFPAAAPAPAGAGKISLKVDAVNRPGTLVSGAVTFSDGQTATWYLDEMGRLGLAAAQKGYRPSAEDVQAFQLELQKEMQKLGY